MEEPMPTTDETGSGAAGEARTVDTVNVIVSDMHLSAGPMLSVRAKHTFRYKMARLIRRVFGSHEPPEVIEVPNALEDFVYDAQFDAFVTKIIATFSPADVLILRLMGDVFDPLAVTWKGSLRDPPFETVAVRKMRTIMSGHPMFFDACTRFLRGLNAQIVIHVGNHDQFLCWSRVQREIVRRISRGDPSLAAKIRFVDQYKGYEDEDGDVLFYHGMDAEPHNVMDPKTAILKDHFGLPLKRPILNKPLGSHMAAELSSRLKLKNPLIGRMPFERDIWQNAIRHKWGWAVYAGLMVVWFLYIQLFAMLDFRRKTGLRTVLRVIGSTMHKHPVDEYGARLLKNREDIRVLVMGHSHVPRRITGPDGTYINTGSWAMRLKLVWPTFTYTWRHLRWLEVHWRNLLYFLETGKVPFANKLIKILGYLLAAGVLVTYLFITFQGNDLFGAWAITLHHLKLLVAILLGFVVVKAVIRFFAVKPEVIDDTEFTFGLIRRGRDGVVTADLMEYMPKDDTIREYV